MGIKLLASFFSAALVPPIAAFLMWQSYVTNSSTSIAVLGDTTISNTPREIPSFTPEQQLSSSLPTDIPLPSVFPTPFPTLSNTPSPTKIPSPTVILPSLTPTNKPTSTPTPTLRSTPLPTKTPTNTPIPTQKLTILPETIITPSLKPTPSPTFAPVTALQLDEWFTTYSNRYSVDRTKLWKIAVCESGLNPNATNGDYGGLYQFSKGTWISTRRAMNENSDSSLRFNAEEAIQTAAFKISTVGLTAWPNCSL